MRERLVLIALTCAVSTGMVWIWAPPAAAQEATDPLSQSQLLEAVKAGGLSAGQLSEIITRRGLDFEMSKDLDRSFRDAGADSNVIDAMWQKERWSPPKGEPLTKDFLTALFQAGTPPQRLSKWIVARKVNFELTAAAVKDLQVAGATDQLLGLITTNNLWAPAAKPTYGESIANAQAAVKVGNYEVAENEANAAKLLDPNRPESYSIIGFINLYRYNSFPKAASEYRSAIEKGGQVEFHVRHVDHITKLRKLETCVGQLLLRKDGLEFRSSRADHNLSVTSKQIAEVRQSGPSAKNPLGRSAVHLLVSRGGGRPTEYIFHADRDHGKNDKDEETIIADLINVIRQ